MKISRDTVSILIVLATCLLLTLSAKVRNTGSDPLGTLLVSEAILTHQTIKIDHYGEDLLKNYSYKIHKKNDHFYYYFPLGTSIASLPVVAAANALGFEMPQHEPVTQILIAAITSALTLLLLIKLANLFLDHKNSLIVASVFWLGSSLASTSATALWSHNFAALFALLAIYGAIKTTKGNHQHLWPLVSASLFFAYLCRPTMALLAPFVLLYLLTYSRPAAIKSGILLLALLGAFAGFSMNEFGQPLPDYYLPQRLAGGDFWTALYGNLLSPARGLFIYSPFIPVAWICCRFAKKEWGLKPSWLLIAVAWPALHLAFVSRFPHWWAGWSYGSRFLTDILPGLFLLTLYCWPTTSRGVAGKAASGVLALACLFAIFVNTGQGLFNRYTASWNAQPNIDQHPEYLFDWRYPQFLANRNGHEARLARYAANHLPAIHPDEQMTFTSDRLVFIGWSDPERTYRWSSSTTPKIIFKTNTIEQTFAGNITFHVDSFGNQNVTMLLNGQQIFSGILNGQDEKILIANLPSTIQNGLNILEFQLPDARRPGGGDRRRLAVALKSIQIE